MTPDRIEVIQQKFVLDVLSKLSNDWQSTDELDSDYNTLETLAWCGVAERQLEQLIDECGIPCGTRFYYKKVE